MTRIRLEDIPDPDGSLRAHLRPYVSVENYLASVADQLPALLAQQQQQPSDPQQRVAQRAHEALMQQLAGATPRLASGADLLQAIEACRLLPVGADSVDHLLLGGLRETTVTEVAGESCSGKTLLCHLAAVTTAQRGERVLYIDSTNGFSARRARQLLEQQYPAGQVADAALSNITAVRCHSVHALLASLDELAQQAATGGGAGAWPKLLVVDSISALLTPVVGIRQHHQGQVLVAETGRLLRLVAEQLKLAALVTNHVVGAARDGAGAAAPGGGGGGGPGGHALSGIDASFKPALGEQWRGMPHVRVQLSRVAGGDLVCATMLTSSLREPGHQAWFRLGETIQDVQQHPGGA